MESPFERPELYDLLFDTLEFDLEIYKSAARGARGPVLDLACGTGRVGLKLLEDGAQLDGVDLYEPMLAHFRKKADARGLKVNLYRGGFTNFQTPRKYALVVCAFNAFAHNLTQADQLETLRRVRDHLLPGGAFLCHMSFPSAELWSGPDGVPILEAEVPAGGGRMVKIYDSRTKNPLEQTQHSEMEIQIVGADGGVIESHKSETDVRWIYKPEFELLLTTAGFSKINFFGDFDRSPLRADSKQLIVTAHL
ncbi:MAG: class I SAM-dependent methyltransferase [Planctomycetes bacterium]|nr:class I SAM-dependent methyltransferase [Planctomycetota bacterium]